MSLFFDRGSSLSSYIEAAGGRTRMAASSTLNVTPDSSLRSSAVWACLRLRADLISTTPIDTYRRINGVQVEQPKPQLLLTPDGEGIEQWLYSSQFDLDRFGNAFGVITETDSYGFAARIELVPAQEVRVVIRQGVIDHYLVASEKYAPEKIWHEKQFTAPGLHVGMSPVAYAAWSIGTYLSAQEFALDWFSSCAAPSGHLRHTLAPTVDSATADAVKHRFKQAVQGRDIFVTGRDWEYEMSAVPANTTMFLEEMKYGIADVCRFFGVPGDMIGAETSTGSITYASVTQRNLQLLILHLNPVYVRREKALSTAMPPERFAKFNTDALLRLDPAARVELLIKQVAGRTLAPSEVREIENRQPFTEEQLAEFDRLWPSRNTNPLTSGVPA